VVQQGFQEYAKRLPRGCELVLKEIPAGKRGKNSDVARIVKEEGERMLARFTAQSSSRHAGYSRKTLDNAGFSGEFKNVAGKWPKYRTVSRRPGRFSGRRKNQSQPILEFIQSNPATSDWCGL